MCKGLGTPQLPREGMVAPPGAEPRLHQWLGATSEQHGLLENQYLDSEAGSTVPAALRQCFRDKV